MRRAGHTKQGGVLLGMVVAIVVVGVVGAAMVKSLRGQAVTSAHTYNLMRARYAADSGYTYFSSLLKEEKLAYASLGDVEYTLRSGDQFVLSVSTNTTFIFAEIRGRRMDGEDVLAVRTLTTQLSIDDSGGLGGGPADETVPGDRLIGDLDLDTVAEIEIQDAWKDKKELKDFIEEKGWGKKKGWMETYAALLNLHEKFVAEDLRTLWGTSLKVRTDLDVRHAQIDPAAKNHVVWEVVVPFTYETQAQAAVTDGYLAYEAQVKVSWQESSRSFYTPYSRVTGAQGLAFKLHGNATGGYEFYAVTLMRFLDDNEKDNRIENYDALDRAGSKPNLAGWSNSDGYWGDYDCIPNDIKPPGQQGKYLLVLWKQEQGKKGPERTWIAYQDLSGDSIANANFMLDATIHLRVSEGIEGKDEFVDVQVMVGDCRSFDSPPGDADPYNRGWWSRRRYRNSTDRADKFSTVFPVWPPVLSQSWTAEVDYYTLMESTATVFNKQETSAGFLGDGETIRIVGEEYLFKNQAEALGDLGLVFCGNFMSGIDHDYVKKDGAPKVKNPTESDYRQIDIPSLYMAVDDLAVKWGDGTVKTGAGIDIITNL